MQSRRTVTLPYRTRCVFCGRDGVLAVHRFTMSDPESRMVEEAPSTLSAVLPMPGPQGKAMVYGSAPSR